MKKVLAILALLGLLAAGGYTLADKKDIICKCGCEQKAVVCGCPVALEQLKALKDI